MMMIVMPALAERDHCEHKTVAAGVASFIAAPSEHVRERVDRESSVREDHGRDEKTPDKHLCAGGMEAREEMRKHRTEPEHRKAGRDRYQGVESIQKFEFRKAREITHDAPTRGKVRFRGYPSDMAPEEAVPNRRVHVAGLI